MSIKAQKTQLVELAVTAGQLQQQRFNFTDQPQLRTEMAGVKIYIDAIETYNNAAQTVSPITGRAIITPAIMATAGLTLFVGNPNSGASNKGEYINFIPLVSMFRIQVGTNAFVRDLLTFPALGVDWSKSYVSVGTPIGGVTEYSFLFNVYYHYGEPLGATPQLSKAMTNR